MRISRAILPAILALGMAGSALTCVGAARVNAAPADACSRPRDCDALPRPAVCHALFTVDQNTTGVAGLIGPALATLAARSRAGRQA